MRKGWVMAVCFLAVLAAGAVAVWPGLFDAEEALEAGAQPAQATPPPQEDPLDAFRLEREQLRAMQVSQLNDIIYGENTDGETRALAQRTLIDALAWQEQETTIEGVLRARGYRDAVATVHADSANILIRCEALTRQESAVVLELVLRETALESGNVKIIPIN